jgi:Tfp pilus assembly protein PilO
MVSLICGFFTIGHIMKKRRQFGIEKDILSKRMKEVNLAATNLEELKTTLDATQKELNILNERVPEAGKIGFLLKQIDFLMKQRKIEMSSIQPSPAQEEKIFIKNPVRLMFKGKFENIYRLIHDLERINRIVVMEKMTIIKEDSSELCRVDLMTSVFER